ncbi:hypothetical protein W02_09360 [Nitrospira sp. KM1]|uniref:nuclear transport factor 2 family protein n=1 Tax=Nitrospira sp. KM1 TaxID=1936990 RepID=UPI0013A76F0F|nr:nuclear transport factor 2 family protein [Nitrospira sp. KM1]BCA53796.1 hypothetical protein W02_09360 [Nitrospira sp. KM1]
MDPQLPAIVRTYIDAKNAFDVNVALECFSDDAVVHDEQTDRRGKQDIKRWLEETINKYHDQLRPIRFTEQNDTIVLTAEISGTFDGSPVELDFHFSLQSGKILNLSIA